MAQQSHSLQVWFDGSVNQFVWRVEYHTDLKQIQKRGHASEFLIAIKNAKDYLDSLITKEAWAKV